MVIPPLRGSQPEVGSCFSTVLSSCIAARLPAQFCSFTMLVTLQRTLCHCAVASTLLQPCTGAFGLHINLTSEANEGYAVQT